MNRSIFSFFPTKLGYRYIPQVLFLSCSLDCCLEPLFLLIYFLTLRVHLGLNQEHVINEV